jgi:hypothetical protein
MQTKKLQELVDKEYKRQQIEQGVPEVVTSPIRSKQVRALINVIAPLIPDPKGGDTHKA